MHLFVQAAHLQKPIKTPTINKTARHFGQLMTWVLDGEKGPERVEIETSNQWQELAPDQTHYAIWIGHATLPD